MRRLTWAVVVVALTGGAMAWSQGTAAQAAPGAVDVLTASSLAAHTAANVAAARKNEKGEVSEILAKYPGHYMLLSSRVKSGGAEFHGHYSDVLIVLDGAGTELTGGTIVDPKEGANGERTGLRLEGATAHVLHKGDVLHLPAGTPHQAIVAPGKTLTLFVIKVEASAAK
jgi:mannose-6-phosphate isomerase-like protein (cupin superfamily)